ncbi:MAG TPA: hypothetical protein VF394_16440, partial [Candidatus Acidoferrum sp.]
FATFLRNRRSEQGGTLAVGEELQMLIEDWNKTLSNGLQLAPQKGVYADDLDAELERLYAEHVAPPRKFSRRCSRQPCNDSQLLLASLESGWTLETHPEVDGRSGVYLSRRPHAHRL